MNYSTTISANILIAGLRMASSLAGPDLGARQPARKQGPKPKARHVPGATIGGAVAAPVRGVNSANRKHRRRATGTNFVTLPIKEPEIEEHDDETRRKSIGTLLKLPKVGGEGSTLDAVDECNDDGQGNVNISAKMISGQRNSGESLNRSTDDSQLISNQGRINAEYGWDSDANPDHNVNHHPLVHHKHRDAHFVPGVGPITTYLAHVYVFVSSGVVDYLPSPSIPPKMWISILYFLVKPFDSNTCL